MTEELRKIGLNVGHRRVGRLMRQNGISVVGISRPKLTIDNDLRFNRALNLLDRDFAADAPKQKWAGDISYVWTREGWLYHKGFEFGVGGIFARGILQNGLV